MKAPYCYVAPILLLNPGANEGPAEERIRIKPGCSCFKVIQATSPQEQANTGAQGPLARGERFAQCCAHLQDALKRSMHPWFLCNILQCSVALFLRGRPGAGPPRDIHLQLLLVALLWLLRILVLMLMLRIHCSGLNARGRGRCLRRAWVLRLHDLFSWPCAFCGPPRQHTGPPSLTVLLSEGNSRHTSSA